MELAKKIAAAVCLSGGLIVAIYGLLSLIKGANFAAGKFSIEWGNTVTAVALIFIGTAIVINAVGYLLGYRYGGPENDGN